MDRVRVALGQRLPKAQSAITDGKLRALRDVRILIFLCQLFDPARIAYLRT